MKYIKILFCDKSRGVTIETIASKSNTLLISIAHNDSRDYCEIIELTPETALAFYEELSNQLTLLDGEAAD